MGPRQSRHKAPADCRLLSLRQKLPIDGTPAGNYPKAPAIISAYRHFQAERDVAHERAVEFTTEHTACQPGQTREVAGRVQERTDGPDQRSVGTYQRLSGASASGRKSTAERHAHLPIQDCSDARRHRSRNRYQPRNIKCGAHRLPGSTSHIQARSTQFAPKTAVQ